MSRPVRVEFSGACYHVMSRGVGRMVTFRDDTDRQRFLELAGELVKDGVLVVHAYCLMPNHYHLLASTPRGELSRWMRKLNGDYARGFNRRHRRVGHLWQGRYKAIVVEGDRYLLECSRYIHLNPNRAKLTRPAQRYRWSSYRNYVGGSAAVSWVETRPVLDALGGDAERYRRFVQAGKGEKPISPFEQAVAGLVLGSEAFVQRVVERLKGRPASPDQPSSAALQRHLRVDPQTVEEATRAIFASAGRARQRRLLLYTQRRFSPLRPSEIARRYGCGPSAVTMATQAIEREAQEKPELANALEALAEILNKNEK